MKSILQNIQGKLSDITDFKYIDEDWGQLNYYQPPVKWPCCLIDINNANYSNIGKDLQSKPLNRQLGKVVAKITIATLKLTNTSMQAPQAQKEQAWVIWDIMQKVHENLHGFSPGETCSKMLRSSLERTQRDDGVQEYQILYEFEINNV
jgi:hypothetical protein